MPKSGSIRSKLSVSVAIALSAAAVSAAEPATQSCERHPQVQGQCFSVYGRARLFSGPPAVRIWVKDSGRTLAVGDGKYVLPGYANLPPELAKLVKLRRNVWATFRVCPFESERPGAMQPVCVESVTHVRLGPMTQPAKPAQPPDSAGP